MKDLFCFVAAACLVGRSLARSCHFQKQRNRFNDPDQLFVKHINLLEEYRSPLKIFRSISNTEIRDHVDRFDVIANAFPGSQSDSSFHARHSLENFWKESNHATQVYLWKASHDENMAKSVRRFRSLLATLKPDVIFLGVCGETKHRLVKKFLWGGHYATIVQCVLETMLEKQYQDLTFGAKFRLAIQKVATYVSLCIPLNHRAALEQSAWQEAYTYAARKRPSDRPCLVLGDRPFSVMYERSVKEDHGDGSDGSKKILSGLHARIPKAEKKILANCLSLLDDYYDKPSSFNLWQVNGCRKNKIVFCQERDVFMTCKLVLACRVLKPKKILVIASSHFQGNAVGTSPMQQILQSGFIGNRILTEAILQALTADSQQGGRSNKEELAEINCLPVLSFDDQYDTFVL